MKIYISIDMEGLAGTFNWDQEKGADRKYVRFAMEEQLRWMLKGIVASKANDEIDEICIADSHGNGDNVSFEFTKRDPRLQLISGSPRPNYMMPAFSKEYDHVFLLGYHAPAGMQEASMDHTYSSSSISSLKINGKKMSEAEINGAYAAFFGVPVSLITGDLALSKHLRKNDNFQDALFVVNKEALSRYSAKSPSLALLEERNSKAVIKVLDEDTDKGASPQMPFDAPFELLIELTSTAKTDVVALMPSAERLEGRTVRLVNNDYQSIFEAITAIALLASHGK